MDDETILQEESTDLQEESTDLQEENTIQQAAENAEKLKEAAQKKIDVDTFTLKLPKPLTYDGETYTTLTFDWSSLNGGDNLAIERAVSRVGMTTTTPEYNSFYLTEMAVRACTYRNKDGRRTVTVETLQALPLRMHRRICAAGRDFLLNMKYLLEMVANGFEK